jgi:uncharacterized Fe-S cluster-containing MiaB family protein
LGATVKLCCTITLPASTVQKPVIVSEVYLPGAIDPPEQVLLVDIFAAWPCRTRDGRITRLL